MRTVILSFGPMEVQVRSSVSMTLSQIVSTSARSQWPEQWMIASLHSHKLKGSANSSYSWKHKLQKVLTHLTFVSCHNDSRAWHHKSCDFICQQTKFQRPTQTTASVMRFEDLKVVKMLTFQRTLVSTYEST